MPIPKILLFILIPLLQADTRPPLGNIPHFLNIPLHVQEENYTCGVAATRSVLHYYGIVEEEETLAVALKADPQEGTDSKNIVKYLNEKGFKASVTTFSTIEQIQTAIRNKFPVMVLIQAWTNTPNVDWSQDWDDGHWVVVTGYDNDHLYFMDPSNPGKYTFLSNKDFLVRWHDVDELKKVWQLALTVEPATPTFEYQVFDRIE